MRVAAVVLTALLLLGAAPAAQPPAVQGVAKFAAEDILNVTTISVLDLTEDGRRVAAVTRRLHDNAETNHDRFGDPSYIAPSRVRLLVIDTRLGGIQMPFKDLVNVRQAAWSHDGRRLAVLVATNGAEPGEAKPTTPPTKLYVWDTERAILMEVPRRGMPYVSLNSELHWSADDRRVVVTMRAPERDREGRTRFKALTEGPTIVHSSNEPFLEWDEMRRSDRRRSLAEVDVATGKATAWLGEQKITSYQVARDRSFVTFLQDVTEKTDYDVIGGTTNALCLIATGSSEPRTIAEGKDLKDAQLRWSDDGRVFAYAKKGEVFVQSIDDEKPRSLTPPPAGQEKEAAAEGGRTPDDDTGEKKESFSVGLFSRDASKLLITSKKGWYLVDVATAERRQVVTLEDDEEKNPRMETVAWSPDGGRVYLTYSARGRWERGLMQLDVASKVMAPLVMDSRLYSAFRMSRDGQTFVFAASDGDRPVELHVANASFTSVRRLTDLNPWVAERAVPKSELVAYRDVDGEELYGVLRYPIGYETGKRYPTIFEIYETFFDNGFNARAAFLANHGYAVFHPSVNLAVGRPGEAWVKGVTTAANKLIEMGIADPERLGVHGTSYGGYATVLLITQTDRFKAAINISGKVNMVSFYTDSPRIGVRNTHAPEKSQDRIGGTLWEYPERYLEHSAILHADRIKTPLLCITGDQDWNVPASQSREMYYALRRLGKEVEWVRYVNGGHRPPNGVAESVDFEQRILAWYDKYLKGGPKKKETEP